MSVTDPEHEFGEDVVKAGSKLRGFTAGEDIEQREIVTVTGDYEVGLANDGGPALGAATATRVEGEEVTIGADDCEVLLESSEPITAGNAITPDGLGGVREAEDGDANLGIALTSSGAGELFFAYITSASGEEVAA